MLKLAEKLPPMGLPVPVPFMALRLITAYSQSIDINFNKLVKVAL
jgi:hypothetical protein